MEILVLCDDLWHPGEVLKRGLAPLGEDAFDLDFVGAPKDILTDGFIRRYDVIVNARGNAHTPGNSSAPWFEPGVTAVMPQDFRRYVEEGRGFLALHAGNTSRRPHPMADFIGNDFIKHPPQCDVTVRPTGGHPITDGIEPFTVRDEHYMIDVFAPDAEVILKSSSDTEAGTQVAGYVRQIGKGRFCALTPGHNLAVFENENYLKLLKQALRWCAGDPAAE